MCDPKFEIIAMALNEKYVARTHNTPEKAVFDVFCNLKPGDCPYDNAGSRLGKNRPGVPFEPHPGGEWTSCTVFSSTKTSEPRYKKPTTDQEWDDFEMLWKDLQQQLEKKLGKKPSNVAVDTEVGKEYGVDESNIRKWRGERGIP